MTCCTEMAISYSIATGMHGHFTPSPSDDEIPHEQTFHCYRSTGPEWMCHRLQYLPANGEQGLSIDCSGEASSWASCYEKAEASCAGTGYRIVSTVGTPATKESDKTLGVDVGNYKSRSVVVVCK